MISQKHLADLANSSLTPETVAAAGLDTVSSREATAALGWSPSDALGDCLAIPYRHEYRDGAWHTLDNYTRYRPDRPRVVLGDDGSERVCKYESPLGSRARVYVPRDTLEWVRLFDGRAPLVLTEGEKKALALLQLGKPALSVPGVWNFSGDDGLGLAPEIEALVAGGRRVVIAYDRDWLTNGQVARAAARLTIRLTRAGADVALFVPGPETSGKGVDDVVTELGGAEFNSRWAGWCRPVEPEQLLAWLLDNARRWSRPRLLQELQAAGAWLRALNRELSAAGRVKLTRWAREFSENVEPHNIDARVVLTALNAAALPTDIEPTSDRPWATRARDFELVHHFSDGSTLPGGTSDILGKAEADLALHLLHRVGTPLVFLRGSFHKYSAGVWVPVENAVLEAELASWHRSPTASGDTIEISARVIGGVLTTLQSILSAPSEAFWSASEVRWLSFSDRAVSFSPTVGLTFGPNDPANRAELGFDGAWTDATPTTWNASLDQWCELDTSQYQDWTGAELLDERRDKVAAIKWWLGSSLLVGPRRTARALALVGGPGTGKSTFCDFVRSLWPSGRTSAISLQRVGEDYQAARLAESFLNVTAELPSTDARDVESIKSLITASDYMSARNPYGRTFSFIPRASVLVGMNGWPALRDYSGAIWDRFLGIRFESRFRNTSSERHDLGDVLASERVDIVCDAIRAAAEWLVRGERPDPRTSREELEEARHGSDPLDEWLSSGAVVTDTTEWTSSTALHAAYLAWATEHGRAALSTNKLASGFRARHVHKKRTNSGVAYRLCVARDLPC